MSLKYSSTTADYLVWSDAMNLIRKLAKDENYKISLLISLGCFTGLRISDINICFHLRDRISDILNPVKHPKLIRSEIL